MLIDDNFENLSASTITIMVKSNLSLELNNIFDLVKKDEKNTYLTKNFRHYSEIEDNSIIYIKFGSNFLGLNINDKETHKDFKGQITFGLIVNKNKIELMIFKNGQIKFVGCRLMNDCINTLLIIWPYLKNSMLSLTVFDPKMDYDIQNLNPTFIFVPEMINMPLKFTHTIDKTSLIIFNKLDENYVSHYEPTSQHYVEVKFYNKSTTRKCLVLTILQKLLFLDTMILNTNTVDKILDVRSSRVTFRIFPGNAIMTGSNIDFEILKHSFNNFQKIINDNQEEILFKKRRISLL